MPVCKILTLSFVIIAFGMISSTVVHAQDNVEDSIEEDAGFDGAYDVRNIDREPESITFVPVGDRNFPDFSPKGMIIGNLIVLPKLTVTETYNDNIFASSETGGSDAVSDTYTTLAPAISIRTIKDRHFFGLQASAEIFRYLEEDSEDRENFLVSGGGHFEIKHDLLLPYNVTYQIGHQDRSDNIARVFTAEPLEIEEFSTEAGLAYKPNRLGFQGIGRFIAKRFQDGVSINDPNFQVVRSDADFNTAEVELQTSYDFHANHSVFLRGTVGKTEYEDSIFDDNAQAYTGVFRDSANGRVLAGLITNYKGILLSEIGVGYATVDYDSNQIDDVENIAVDADIDWNITKLTTLGLAATRSIIQDNEIVQGIVQTRATLSVDHELQRSLLLNGYITYLNRDFESITREDDLYRIGLGILYRPSPYFNVGAEYIHTTQDSTSPGNEFDQNAFLVRATAQY